MRTIYLVANILDKMVFLKMIHHHGSIPSVLDLISALSSLLLIKDCVVPAITSWQAEPLEAPNMMTIKMALMMMWIMMMVVNIWITGWFLQGNPLEAPNIAPTRSSAKKNDWSYGTLKLVFDAFCNFLWVSDNKFRQIVFPKKETIVFFEALNVTKGIP